MNPYSFRSSAGLLLTFLVTLGLFGGCAGTRGPGTDNVEDRDSISDEELAAVSGTNLYDALQRIRPLWLMSSGARARSVRVPTATIVLADGRYFGRLASLRQLPVAGVQRIRYLSGSEAANSYPGYPGGSHVDAAIVVEYGNERR